MTEPAIDVSLLPVPLTPPLLGAASVPEAIEKALAIYAAADTLVVETEADESQAGQQLTMIRGAVKYGQQLLKDTLAPHKARIKEIEVAFHEVVDPLKLADHIISVKMAAAFNRRKAEQERQAREAERLRLEAEAEAARLRAEAERALREQEEAIRRAAEANAELARIAQAQAVPTVTGPTTEAGTYEEFMSRQEALARLEGQDPVDPVAVAADAREIVALTAADAADAQTQAIVAQMKVEEIAPPPPPAAKTVQTMSGTVTNKEGWDYEVTDLDKVPDQYITRTLNARALRSAITAAGEEAGLLQIPGIKIIPKVTIATRLTDDRRRARLGGHA